MTEFVPARPVDIKAEPECELLQDKMDNELVTLIHVGTWNVPIGHRQATVDDIVRVSCGRNAVLGISGALMSTAGHFAQLLEGTPAAVDTAMADIVGDDRHAALVIVRREPIAARQFTGWSLIYSGRSMTLDDMLHGLTRGSDRSDVDALVGVMLALAVPGPP